MGTESNKISVQLTPSCDGEITRVLDRIELSAVRDVSQLLQIMERAKSLSGVELVIRRALQSSMAQFGGTHAMLRLAGYDQPIRYIEVKVTDLSKLPYDNLYLAI
jgi:hypothetical protein